MKKIIFFLPVLVFFTVGCSQTQTTMNPIPVTQMSTTNSTKNISPATPPTQITQPNSTRASSTNVLVTVMNSGSTNTSSYNLKIFEDGSAELFVQGKPEQDFKTGSAGVAGLQSLLQTVPDVSKLQGRCMKSVSFGTVTKITYNGKTSGDISCIFTGPGHDISLSISQIESELKIGPVMRVRGEII